MMVADLIDIKIYREVNLEAEELELIALIVIAARERHVAIIKYVDSIRIAVLVELYVRKFQVFHFIKKRKMKFKTSEVIALQHALLHLPVLNLNPETAYVDIVRNKILDKLNKSKCL